MKVTIRDVAEAAGVSAMTVSSVLHGSGANVRVSAETAERIRNVAEELNYKPNTLARSLRNKKTEMVGVVCQDLDRLTEENPYYPQLLSGIMAALFPRGYTLALCPALLDARIDPSLSDGRFDGLLWARPDFTDKSLAAIRKSHVPIVMMHAPENSAPGIPTFTADNDDAMRQVVDHLAGLGHRSIAFVVDEFNEHTAEGNMRFAACRKAANETGLEVTLWVWDERTRTLDKFIAQNRHLTAMVCFSDTLAGQILASCAQLGVVVPRDISVVGFDSSSFCERTHPRLTSVHQPVDRIAFEATNHLLTLIQLRDGGGAMPPPLSSLYACSLDVRDSTARPASSTMKITHEKI